MRSDRHSRVTLRGLRYLRTHGLRLAKHRSYCWPCRALTRHAVGRGRKPVCLECAP